jgi:hypothetical protein
MVAMDGDHIKIEISDAVKVATGCVGKDGTGRAGGGADEAGGNRYAFQHVRVECAGAAGV